MTPDRDLLADLDVLVELQERHAPTVDDVRLIADLFGVPMWMLGYGHRIKPGKWKRTQGRRNRR